MLLDLCIVVTFLSLVGHQRFLVHSRFQEAMLRVFPGHIQPHFVEALGITIVGSGGGNECERGTKNRYAMNKKFPYFDPM